LGVCCCSLGFFCCCLPRGPVGTQHLSYSAFFEIFQYPSRSLREYLSPPAPFFLMDQVLTAFVGVGLWALVFFVFFPSVCVLFFLVGVVIRGTYSFAVAWRSPTFLCRPPFFSTVSLLSLHSSSRSSLSRSFPQPPLTLFLNCASSIIIRSFPAVPRYVLLFSALLNPGHGAPTQGSDPCLPPTFRLHSPPRTTAVTSRSSAQRSPGANASA